MPLLRNKRTGWEGPVTDEIARDRLRYPDEYELVTPPKAAQKPKPARKPTSTRKAKT